MSVVQGKKHLEKRGNDNAERMWRRPASQMRSKENEDPQDS